MTQRTYRSLTVKQGGEASLRPVFQAQQAASWGVARLFQEYPGDVPQRGRSPPTHLDLETVNLANTRLTDNFTHENCILMTSQSMSHAARILPMELRW